MIGDGEWKLIILSVASLPSLHFNDDVLINTGDNLHFPKRFNNSLSWRI